MKITKIKLSALHTHVLLFYKIFREPILRKKWCNKIRCYTFIIIRETLNLESCSRTINICLLELHRKAYTTLEFKINLSRKCAKNRNLCLQMDSSSIWRRRRWRRCMGLLLYHAAAKVIHQCWDHSSAAFLLFLVSCLIENSLNYVSP